MGLHVGGELKRRLFMTCVGIGVGGFGAGAGVVCSGVGVGYGVPVVDPEVPPIPASSRPTLISGEA